MEVQGRAEECRGACAGAGVCNNENGQIMSYEHKYGGRKDGETQIKDSDLMQQNATKIKKLILSAHAGLCKEAGRADWKNGPPTLTLLAGGEAISG